MSATPSMPGRVERRRGHDEDRAVQEEREHQRDGRIDVSRTAPPRACSPACPGTCRVWMIDECRYRLCGITVAPRIPTAM